MSSCRTLIAPFEPAAPPAELERLAPRDVLARWRAVDRSVQAPRIVAVAGGDGWIGAALVTSRPGTAYLKIVDAVGDATAAVAAVEAYAREAGLVQVKWEGWTTDAAGAAASGFVPLQRPLTATDDADEPRTGYVRWLTGGPVAEPPYYRQSESFTCGAVVALVAQVQAGALPSEALDRAAELTLWRAATNFNACEPVGLGVAVRRAWPGSAVTVSLDVERPIILDFYPEADREWRAVLQRASRADAAAIGVPIDSGRLSLPALRHGIESGERILLLISLAAMQGFDVPHWVLCHGVVAGAVVIEDPWVHAPRGETWLDAHLLPIPDASLDDMSALESDGFRGAVRLA